MGLAASQARLLTVTSRLSDIEYKQQQISNMKMRMSVENEQIANDYSEALNNQTLELNDGTGQVAFTYDNLVNAGYGVMKTSDGSLATSTTTSTTTGGTTTSQTVTPISSDILQWAGKSEPVLGQGNYTLINPTVVSKPTAPTLVKDTTNVSSASTSTNKVTMASLGMSSMQSTVQTLLNSSYVTQRAFNTTSASNAIDTAINNLTPYVSQTGTYFSSAISSLNTAKSNLSALTMTVSKTSTSNFRYAQNTVDEVETGSSSSSNARRVAQKQAVSTDDLTLDDGLTLTRNYKISNSSIVSKYTTQAMNYVQSGITMLNSSTSSSASASGNTSSTLTTTLYQQQLAKYNQYIANLATDEATKTKWQTDHDNWQAYQNLSASQKQYGNQEGVDATSVTTSTTTTTNTTYNDLATLCRNNPQFLIQGLLSGYLTLTDADGNPTSLDSNTAISTVYDKSDDAKAEAEYESRMSKLNRKEKQLDNQMSELDTEYSALTTEYESIKSIISTHSQKDFELFS